MSRRGANCADRDGGGAESRAGFCRHVCAFDGSARARCDGACEGACGSRTVVVVHARASRVHRGARCERRDSDGDEGRRDRPRARTEGLRRNRVHAPRAGSGGNRRFERGLRSLLRRASPLAGRARERDDARDDRFRSREGAGRGHRVVVRKWKARRDRHRARRSLEGRVDGGRGVRCALRRVRRQRSFFVDWLFGVRSALGVRGDRDAAHVGGAMVRRQNKTRHDRGPSR